MRGSNMRPRAQLSIPTILIALVACAALLGWWNAASSLRQNQAKLDAMLRAHPVQPKPMPFVPENSTRPEVPQNRCETPEQFIAALRSISDWHEFADDTAGPFAKASVADEAIPLLLELLNDPDLMIRVRALATLGKIHRHPDTIVPALIRFLNDENPGIRWQAACALGQFRGDAAAAVPALLAQMNDDQSPIAAFSAEMLREIDRSICVEDRLIELLSQQEGPNRNRAIDTLADLRTPTARDALVGAFRTETDKKTSHQLAQAIRRADAAGIYNTAEPGVGAGSR